MKIKRLMLILSFCILLILPGCERLASILNPPENTGGTVIEYLFFSDYGCAGDQKRSDSPGDVYLSGYTLIDDTLTLTIHYTANCCPAFVERVSVEDNRIDIRIEDTLNGCRCMCPYENSFRFLFPQPGRVHLRFGWMGEAFILDTVIVVQPSRLVLRHGTSFGECLGYCWKEIEVIRTNVTYTQVGWNPEAYPEITETGRITEAEWAALLAAIDAQTMQRMDDRYGCPDCADGGAEWIEVVTPEWRKKITFEYGEKLRGIQDLIDQMREIQKRFEDGNA